MALSLAPDGLLALAELLSFDDVGRLAATSLSTLRTLEAANNFLCLSAFPGMELFGWRQFKAALFQQFKESTQPQLLLNVNWCPNRKKGMSSVTAPMPIAFETSGRFFLKLWVSAGKAWNGCPSVGVVDATKVRQDPSKLWDDLSRSSKPSDVFAMACNPYTGKIHVSNTSEVRQSLLDGVPLQGTSSFRGSFRSWCADVVGWQSGESATRGRLRASIEIGVLISNGTLEFVREGPNGWERSGVVWDRLPAKVLCAAFLFDFVGQAIASIEEVHVNELPRILHKTSRTVGIPRGKLSSWIGWPVVC